MTTATSDNPGVATATLDGNQLKITGVGAGSTSIHVRASDATAASEKTLDVKVSVWPRLGSLDGYTWQQISDISAGGRAASTFKVGDSKKVPLFGLFGRIVFHGEQYGASGIWYAVIMGINHNAAREGGNRIHFALGKNWYGKDIVMDRQNFRGSDGVFGRHNDTADNSVGWTNSNLRKEWLPDAKKALPADLRAVIKPVTKWTGAGGSSKAVVSTLDELFLPSAFEIVGGKGGLPEDACQQQYDYCKQCCSPLRYGAYFNTAQPYWTRTPLQDGKCYAVIDNNEITLRSSANNGWGVLPFFCV